MNLTKRHWFQIGLFLLAVSAVPINFAAGIQTDAAQKEKVVPQAKAEKTATKKEPIYDEEADAEKQIATALKKAKTENQRVLIQWGGNWCGWCYKLHDIMEQDRAIATTLRNEYQVVLIDVGSFDKNAELLKKYQADIKKHGLPFLTVLNSEGDVVVNQETTPLESTEEGKAEHDAQAVLDFLAEHQAKPAIASEVLAAAIKEARESKKLVFLHFGAPWCGWCHYLEDWMAEEEQSLLHEQFVDVKIDTDRMEGGQELLESYRDEPSGIPWFAFIDPNTEQAIVTSSGPTGNVGFPSTDEEIGYFAAMLGECGQRFSDDEIASIKRSLVANRKQREIQRQRRMKQMETARQEAGK